MFTTKYEVIVIKNSKQSVLHYKSNVAAGLRMAETMVRTAVEGMITFRDPKTNKPIRHHVSLITEADDLKFTRLPDDHQDRVIKVIIARMEYYIIGDLPLYKIHARLHREFERFGKLRMRSVMSNQFREVTSIKGGIDLEEVVHSEDIASRIFHDRTENYRYLKKGGIQE